LKNKGEKPKGKLRSKSKKNYRGGPLGLSRESKQVGGGTREEKGKGRVETVKKAKNVKKSKP